MARSRHSFCWSCIFFSGVQSRDAGVSESAIPPVSISADTVPKAKPGREDKASAVITTGPITDVVLIIEESNA